MATHSIRTRDKDSLAVFLGWFSVGLGTAQLVAPKALCKLVGASGEGTSRNLMRLMGVLVGWFAAHHRDLSDRLRIASERDHLTGLLNTRAFDAALTTRLEQRRAFGLILADLDNMKQVNDTEGHAVGNDVLRHAGELLASRCGPEEQVARIGGDEFAVITSQSSSESVRALCNRLSAALVDSGISMSFGWGVCPRDGDTSLLLFRAADERLYAQKLIRSRLTSAEIVELPTQTERLARRVHTA